MPQTQLPENFLIDDDKLQNLILFLGSIPLEIAMFDLEMNYMFASQRFYDGYKIKEQDIIGRCHYDVFPDLPDRWRIVHQDCLVRGKRQSAEEAFEREDGSVLWLEWTVYPWYKKNREIGGMILYTQIINERKSQELALNSLLEGTSAVTGNDFFEVLTKQIAIALGVTHVFVSKKNGDHLETLSICINQEHFPNITYAIAQTPCEVTLAQGKYYCPDRVREEFPNEYITQLGLNDYLGISMKNANGESSGVLCVMNRDSIVSPERAQIVLEIFASRAGAEIERLEVWEKLERLNNQLQQRIVEVEQRTVDLNNTREQLIAQEKLAYLGILTAGVAHEIRNPLNFIKNYAEDSKELGEELNTTIQPLLEAIPSTTAKLIQSLIDDLQENAKIINHHAQRADQTIHSMMNHTRSGNDKLEFQPTNINQLVNQNAKLAIESKHLRHPTFRPNINSDYASGFGVVDVVIGSMSRAIINIVENACDAMLLKQAVLESNNPEVAANYQPTIYFSTTLLESQNRQSQIEIRIKDNGSGVSPDIQSKILTPFFTTKPPGEGSGLGLSITHDIIVKQHQGMLIIHTNQPNEPEFTEIIIRLPFRQFAIDNLGCKS